MSADIPSHHFPHASDPPGAPRHADHFVELYDDESVIVESIRTFITGGFTQGDAAVVVARPSVRGALEEGSLSIRAAAEGGRFRSLDAEETLAMFMDGEMPDPKRFEVAIREIVASVARPNANVRVYGEMVAVLWERGNVTAALALEDLWNDLMRRVPIKLFCGYRLGSVEAVASGAAAVCDRHSHVLTPSHGVVI